MDEEYSLEKISNNKRIQNSAKFIHKKPQWLPTIPNNSNNNSDVKNISEESEKCENMIINYLKKKLDDYINNLNKKVPIYRNFNEISYKYKFIKNDKKCTSENMSRAFGRNTLKTIELAKWFYNDYNAFTFTNPLIEWDDTNVILSEKRHYKEKLKENDKVFIFARLDRKNEPDHLTILIINSYGEMYTVGFGYIDSGPIEPSPFLKNLEKKTSAILLPDYIFEIQMFRQACNDSINGSNKYLKLIASTVLTTDFKNKLFNMLDNIKYKDISKIDYYLFEWQSNHKNIKKFNEEVIKQLEKQNTKFINANEELKELKAKKDTSLFIVNKHYYMNLPDIKYCRISPVWRASKYPNCASFIDNIFDNILDCSLNGLPIQWFSVEPKYCKQSSKSQPLKCRDTMDYTLKYWNTQRKKEQSKTQSIFKDVTKQKVTNVPVEEKIVKRGFWDRLTGKTNNANLEECQKSILDSIDLNFITQRNDTINEDIKKSLKKYNNIYILNHNNDVNIKNQVPSVWSFKNEHLHNYVYSSPIVTFENNNVINHINEISIGDRINIWTTYNKFSISEKKAHICCQIITKNNKNFTFGFGTDYMNCIGRFQKNNNIANTFLKQTFSKCKLTFNTPDNIFEKKLLYQKLHQNRKYVKLIASSNINSEQLENIKKILTSLEINDINIEIIRLKHNIFNTQIQNELKIINQEVINQLNETRIHQYVNNASIIELNKNDMFCIYKSYGFKVPNLQYCTLSSKSNKSYNCSSIIFNLFKGIISCGGNIIENIIIHPSLCTQNKNIPVPNCKKVKKSESTKKTTLKKENIKSSSKKSQRVISLTHKSLKIEEPQKGWFGRMVNKLRPKKTVKRTIKVSPTKINIKENLPWYKRIFRRTKKNNL